jgi:hypothetical protein
MTIALSMRRYNLYTSLPGIGRFEITKENPKHSVISHEDYWNECFTWQDLKKIVPYFRSQGWKISVEPLSQEESVDKIHIISFTYGINHDFRILKISGIRVIMARDIGIRSPRKESYNPIGY